MLTNKKDGTIYIGVTSDLSKRITEHKQKKVAGFTSKCNLTKLIYVEFHDSIEDAIYREKCIKGWKRAWKVELIEETNPDWRDITHDVTH